MSKSTLTSTRSEKPTLRVGSQKEVRKVTLCTPLLIPDAVDGNGIGGFVEQHAVIADAEAE
jgi:hypothetical protein